jgi:hypothetical protein
MSRLEDRYRRLLALYPAAHRRRYHAEMLATLLDSAGDHQRTPRPRETVDLIWNAIRLRLTRDSLPRPHDRPRLTAAAVFATLASMALVGLHAMVPLGALGLHQRVGALADPVPRSVPELSAAAGAWLLIAVCAVAGWRRVGAVLAWLAVLGMAGTRLAGYPGDPASFVARWPFVVLGVTIAVCLTVSRPAEPVHRTLGTRSLVLFGIAAAALGASQWVEAMLADVRIIAPVADPDASGPLSTTYTMQFWHADIPGLPGPAGITWLTLLVISVAFIALTLRVMVAVGASIRRRLVALLLAPAVTAVIVHRFFGDFSWSLDPWKTPAVPTFGQWLGLVIVPLATAATGVLIVRRLDRREHLIALGLARVHDGEPNQVG